MRRERPGENGGRAEAGSQQGAAGRCAQGIMLCHRRSLAITLRVGQGVRAAKAGFVMSHLRQWRRARAISFRPPEQRCRRSTSGS